MRPRFNRIFSCPIALRRPVSTTDATAPIHDAQSSEAIRQASASAIKERGTAVARELASVPAGGMECISRKLGRLGGRVCGVSLDATGSRRGPVRLSRPDTSQPCGGAKVVGGASHQLSRPSQKALEDDVGLTLRPAPGDADQVSVEELATQPRLVGKHATGENPLGMPFRQSCRHRLSSDGIGQKIRSKII